MKTSRDKDKTKEMKNELSSSNTKEDRGQKNRIIDDYK
jgi:hypothetical protein